MTYEHAVALARNGRLVVAAPGVRHGRPVCRWLACPLNLHSARIAHDPDKHVRVGQMIGVLTVLREHPCDDGFRPV